MAKKRGTISPLGNAPGSVEAQQSAAKQNLNTLTAQIRSEAEAAGVPLKEILGTMLGEANVGKESVWQLASGNTARFTEVVLTYEQVLEQVVVRFEVNGRDQEALTEESLSNLDSMEHQQFYPAVARMNEGKIEILDGSRRLAKFKFAKGRIKGFRLLITDDDVSTPDAKALAKSLQSAKEHTIREIGKRCPIIAEQAKKEKRTLSQSDLANELGYSQATISRALKVASVDDALVSLFPVLNDLSYADYMLLAKIQKECGTELAEFIELVTDDIAALRNSASVDDVKGSMLELLKSASAAPKKAPETIVTTLMQFDTKGVYARKKVKGRAFSYEFGRLPSSVQNELDQAIQAVLEKH